MRSIFIFLLFLLAFSAKAQYSETITCSGGALEFVIDYDQQTCTNECNGNYNISIVNGIGPYSYSITGPSYTGNLSLDSFLCPGLYSITVIDDGQGISCSHNFDIIELSPIIFTTSVTNATSVTDCNGAAEISLSGGVPPYSYQWYNSDTVAIAGETNSTIDSLCVGTFFIQFWDNTPPCGWGTDGYGTGGSGSNMVSVTVNAPLEISVGVYNELCPGMCNGAISISVTGGSGNYSYNYPVQEGFPGSVEIINCCYGPYDIVVTDDAGGYASASVFVDAFYVNYCPPAISNETCSGACNGTISLSCYSSGYGINSFSKNGGITWQSSPIFSGLCPGGYSFIGKNTSLDPNCEHYLGNFLVAPGAPNTTANYFVSACDSYTWINGITYYSNNNSATHTILNAAGCDSTITLKLTINQSEYVDTFATVCESILWYGNYYSESGIYSKSFTNSTGCNSIIYLNLTVNNNTGVDIVSSCESYTWIDGNTYFESNNIANHTLTNQYGCDSVITLDLTINNSYSEFINISTCDSYEWLGNIYTNSGIYVQNFADVNGCDSVLSLNLEIYESYQTDTFATVCDTFSWNGNTYNQSGIHQFNYFSENGCDSIVELNLSVLYSTYLNNYAWSCDSFTWTNGITYFQDTTISLYYTNSNGCDSVKTLFLDILNSSHIDTFAIACDSFEWNGNTHYTSGIYPKAFINEEGCNSIITLELIINSVNTNLTIIEPYVIADAENAEYQWLDCDNNFSAIPFQSEQSFTAISSGNYSVEIIENGCMDTSECVYIVGVDVEKISSENHIFVYPNPTEKNAIIVLDKVYKSVQMKVYTMENRLVNSYSFSNIKTIPLEIIESEGIYLIELISEEGKNYLKLIKKQ
ncbi:MAG: T9SS type A sorting domain-containing protein [Bacteroidales bacterium]|nr:T9SS type A sorting domain-containing protein [Bacteroidales bacterium]